jgi:probable phosphoglycerate mutase
MSTEFLLIRHAVNDWVHTGKLAGWTPGVHLNQDGKEQASALGERLAKTTMAAIYASPLERTMETAAAIVAHHPELNVQPLEGVGEVRFGSWQGAKLSKLQHEKLWQIVQIYPSRARFPGGETIRQAQLRAVDAIEDLALQYPNERVAVVSHSDVIKLILVHYLGAHLDAFQRLEISPASLTIIRLGTDRPYVIRMNDTSYLPQHRPSAPPPAPKWSWMRRALKW